MSHNLYDHIFERHIYIQREVDQKLGVIVDSFLRASGRPMRWISLASPQGRGNTLLLERVHRLKASQVKDDLLKIFVTATSSPSPDLNPLAAELYALHITRHRGFRGWLRSKMRELKRRLQNSSRRQILANILVVAGCLMVTCILKGVDQYVTNNGGQVTTLYGWGAFFFNYLPRNWDKFPLWFLVGSSVGLPLSLATVYMTSNGLLPAPPNAGTPSKSQIAELSSLAGLEKALFDLFKSKRRLLLLVDDIHQLPSIEQDFLRRLFVPEVKDDFTRKGWQILIVTVDRPGIDREEILHKDMHGSFETLEVPPFELVDLQAIVESQLPTNEIHSEEDRLAFLEQAQDDINALFASQDQHLIEEMGQKFQDNDIEGEFTPSKLLVYRLVRRDRWISKTALTKWLNLLQTEAQFQIFQLTQSESDQGLVFSLGRSNLVNRQGETIVFQTERMEALTQWIKQHNPFLLAQAHYYWFKNSLKQVNGVAAPSFEVGSLTDEERQHLRRGAWHAIQLDALEAVPKLLAERQNLSGDERRKLQHEAAVFLLPAVALLRSEGDFVRANTLADNLAVWLRASDEPQRDALLDRLADHAWRNYALSGDPSARKCLETLSQDFPHLVSEPAWKIYKTFDELRQGHVISDELPNEADLSEPDHQNLHRLTTILLEIRQRHGFLSAALADHTLIIPEAVKSVAGVAEFELRHLRAAALNERDQIDALRQALQEWRSRLLEIKVADDLLGDKALYAYQRARYWHLLSDVWQRGAKRIGELPESERQVSEEGLITDLRALSLIPDSQDQPLPISLAAEAENSYEETRQLALLLGWRSLLMEAGFHLGVLLEEYDPEDSEPEKWEWDKLFMQVTHLENQLGWLVHTPTAHKIRWERVHQLDRELSIEDAYNVYQTVIRAGYPAGVIVEWHQRTAGLLNNYGQDEEDRKRSAQFFEEWARNLARQAEAAPFRIYQNLSHEQANALILAAQAWRLLQNFNRAEELLKEADGFLSQNSADPSDGNDDSSLRFLQLRLRLQRAWLLGAQEKKAQHEEMIRSIWGDLRLEDSVLPIVLGSLLAMETSAGKLKEAWPASQGLAPYVDPENDRLSLPPAWFEEPDPLKIKNRFEFRFRQLIHLIDDSPDPQYQQLRSAVVQQWFGREKFGEIALDFAEAASAHAPHLEALTVSLLEAIRAYFSLIEGLDRKELEALRLLMQHQTGAKRYRTDYVKVLVEFEDLVEREERIRQISEWSNWSSVAIWASTYLGLLADQSLIRLDIAKTNQTVEQLIERREQVAKAFQAAREKYYEGNSVGSLRDLEKILALPSLAYVLIEDIVVLDLWIKCKQKNSDTQNDEFNQRTTELRKAVIQYIKQLRAIIPESQVQVLALNVLSDLQRVSNKIRSDV